MRKKIREKYVENKRRKKNVHNEENFPNQLVIFQVTSFGIKNFLFFCNFFIKSYGTQTQTIYSE